jgi:hypothetical protein
MYFILCIHILFYSYLLFFFFFFIDLRWFCHVDDDNYVNVPALNGLLKMYNPIKDWYLGRTSTTKPLQIRTKSQVSFHLYNYVIDIFIIY